MDRRSAPAVTAVSVPCTPAAFAELGSEILRAGSALRFRAHGSSMAPLVRDRDVLLIRPAEPCSVRLGDVVLCSSEPGRVVVHRVVRRVAAPHGTRFTVQGDAVLWPDGTIPAAQIHGRVTAIERAGIKIDLDRPAMRVLGCLAALRSRWSLGRSRGFGLACRLARRLPGLSRYLDMGDPV